MGSSSKFKCDLIWLQPVVGHVCFVLEVNDGTVLYGAMGLELFHGPEC